MLLWICYIINYDVLEMLWSCYHSIAFPIFVPSSLPVRRVHRGRRGAPQLALPLRAAPRQRAARAAAGPAAAAGGTTPLRGRERPCARKKREVHFSKDVDWCGLIWDLCWKWDEFDDFFGKILWFEENHACFWGVEDWSMTKGGDPWVPICGWIKEKQIISMSIFEDCKLHFWGLRCQEGNHYGDQRQ